MKLAVSEGDGCFELTKKQNEDCCKLAKHILNLSKGFDSKTFIWAICCILKSFVDRPDIDSRLIVTYMADLIDNMTVEED